MTPRGMFSKCLFDHLTPLFESSFTSYMCSKDVDLSFSLLTSSQRGCLSTPSKTNFELSCFSSHHCDHSSFCHFVACASSVLSLSSMCSSPSSLFMCFHALSLPHHYHLKFSRFSQVQNLARVSSSSTCNGPLFSHSAKP